MARKTSPAEDMVELVSLLPWWAGLLLAVLSYAVLHHFAARSVVAPAVPGQVSHILTDTLWHVFAMAGQYFLPLICVLGSGTSAWRRHQRRTLLAKATYGRAAQGVAGMSWREFEALVSEAFRLQGFRVEETGGKGPDGGVDLVLTRDGETHLVQCKHWRAEKVGVQVVRELYGVMAATGAEGGYVVTSGRFTDDATEFASGRNVELLDGDDLAEMIRRADAARSGRRRERAAAGVGDQRPSCPICSREMVRRTAKRGANAGEEFWGCSAYPSCRGIRAIG